MKVENPALILFAAVLVVAIGYLVARWASKDYRRVLQQQASTQFRPVVPDLVLGELKAKMFGAGYDAGRVRLLQWCDKFFLFLPPSEEFVARFSGG